MFIAYQIIKGVKHPARIFSTEAEAKKFEKENARAFSFDGIEEVSFAELYNGVIYLDPNGLKEAQSKPIRAERDRRLAETDYLLMPDYPISEAERDRVKAYRQALRDLPTVEGFPWSGKVDDPAVPWPLFPELKTAPELQPTE